MAKPFVLFIVGFMVFVTPLALWALSYGWYRYPGWGQLMLVGSLTGLFAYAWLGSRSLFSPIPLLATGLIGVGLAVPVMLPVLVGTSAWGIAWLAVSLSVPLLGCCIIRRLRASI